MDNEAEANEGQQQQMLDEQRRQEEAEALRVSLAIAAYADAGIRRDRDSILYGTGPAKAYEHNGWLYGAGERPTYSDTPKENK